MNWDLDYYTGGNAGLRGILNGWTLSPIIKIRSGLPFTVTNGSVSANLDGNHERTRGSRSGIRTSTTRRRSSGSTPPPSSRKKVVTGVATNGNTPRNTLEGPGSASSTGPLAQLPAAGGTCASLCGSLWEDPQEKTIMRLYIPPDNLSPAAKHGFITRMGVDDKIFGCRQSVNMAVKGSSYCRTRRGIYR